MAREQHELLQDIVREARLAQSFVAGLDEAAFAESTMAQHAVERALEIIGEAMGNLDALTQQSLGDAAVPVRQAISMRNRLAHEYWTIKPSVLWATATEHMEPLLAAVAPLLPVSIEKSRTPAPDPPQRRPQRME